MTQVSLSYVLYITSSRAAFYVLYIGDGCEWSQAKDGVASQQYYDNSFDVGCSTDGGTEKTSVHDRAMEAGTQPGPALLKAASRRAEGPCTLIWS